MEKGKLLTNRLGGIVWAEMFRPVLSNNIKIDQYENSWKQVTAVGWQRQCDNRRGTSYV